MSAAPEGSTPSLSEYAELITAPATERGKRPRPTSLLAPIRECLLPDPHTRRSSIPRNFPRWRRNNAAPSTGWESRSRNGRHITVICSIEGTPWF